MLEPLMWCYCYKAEYHIMLWNQTQQSMSDHQSYVTATADTEAPQPEWLCSLHRCPVRIIRKNGDSIETSMRQLHSNKRNST